MPGCCVIGCTNRSEQGYRTFLIPQGDRNEARRSQWILNIGRPGLSLKSVVCEAHFTADQFENKRQDNKRFLKWNAVPTVFCNDLSSVRTNGQKRKSTRTCTVTDDVVDRHVFNKKASVPSFEEVKGNLLLVENQAEETPCQVMKFVKNKNDSAVRKSMRKVKSNIKAMKDFYYYLEDIDKEPSRKKSRINILGQKKNMADKNAVVISVDQICRICGKLSELLSPIFGDSCEKNNLPVLIERHLPVKVGEKDDAIWSLSVNICDHCVKQLTEWDKFVDKCVKVDRQMFFKKETGVPPATHLSIDHNYCPTVNNTTSLSIVGFQNNSDDVVAKNDISQDRKCYCRVDDEHQSSGGKREYKIGITLVKCKESNQDGHLDFNALKTLLIEKVNWLFKSICNDKLINSCLVDLCGNGVDGDVSRPAFDIDNKDVEDVEMAPVHKNSNLGGGGTTQINDGEGHSGIESQNLQESSLSLAFARKCGPYLCSDCGHLLKKWKSFQQHRRVHHQVKKCDHCDLTLSSYFDYRRHIRDSHKDIICNIACDLCGAKFIKMERLHRHKLVIHNVGEYYFCDVCGKKCASKQQLHCHKSDKHHADKNLCPYCGEYFASHNSFASHVRSKHASGKLYQCTICHKKLTTFNSLIIHTARHANTDGDGSVPALAILDAMLEKQMYSCLVCSIKVGDADMLQQHMGYHSQDPYVKTLSGLESGKWICHLCNKYFEKERELALHRFYFHCSMPFLCQVNGCKSTFWRKSGLVVHRLSVHKARAPALNPETLNDYNRKQSRAKSLRAKSHHRSMIKPFECNVCCKKFSSEATLKTHAVVHSDVKKYCCSFCKRTFKLKLTLSKHLQFHARNKINNGEGEQTDMITNTCITTGENKSTCDVVSQLLQENEPDCGLIPDEEDEEVGRGVAVMQGDLFKICTMFKCRECNALLVSEEALDGHLLEVHGGACDKGQSSTVQFDVLTLSVQQHHPLEGQEGPGGDL